jgi:hypothetical protein
VEEESRGLTSERNRQALSERVSQEELRGSNENLIQAETIIQRGERGTDRKDSQSNRERVEEQEQQLESWAKANNLWYNDYPEAKDGSLENVIETDGYTNEEIETIKNEIEDGNIRDQKSFDKWAKSNLDQQGSDNSDSFDAKDRAANADNDRLDLQTSEGKSRRGQSNQNSQDDFRTSFIRVYNNDGTNGPRYIPINTNEILELYATPQGEIKSLISLFQSSVLPVVTPVPALSSKLCPSPVLVEVFLSFLILPLSRKASSVVFPLRILTSTLP